MRRVMMLMFASAIAAPSAAAPAERASASVEISGYVPASCRVVSSASGEPNWQCNSPAQQVFAETTETDSADQAGNEDSRSVTVAPIV